MFSKCFNGYFQLIHLCFLVPSRLGQIGNFSSEIGKKHILFGILNGAEFRPQILVIKSPEYSPLLHRCESVCCLVCYVILLSYHAKFRI